MNDLTIVYYTANRIEETFSRNVRNHLLSYLPKEVPIISVSHKPMDFGENICMSNLEPSIYNIYVQILKGAHSVKTKFMACCEDDALYNIEHFNHRPPEGYFAYNINKWMVNDDVFFHRNRVNMSMCIAHTDLMIDTLEKRFEKFPKVMTREEMGVHGFGEPGKFESRYGLPEVKIETFMTEPATLTFNHRISVGGFRKLLPRDVVVRELAHWGKAEELWERMYNGRV